MTNSLRQEDERKIQSIMELRPELDRGDIVREASSRVQGNLYMTFGYALTLILDEAISNKEANGG